MRMPSDDALAVGVFTMIGMIVIGIVWYSERVSAPASAAAAIIGGNNDLLTSILTRLPAKTVARFKRVNKQWLSLIYSEPFIRLHVQNHGRHKIQHSFIMSDVHGRPELFICHHTKKNHLVRVSIPSPIRKPLCKYNILQSWNGLLLISMKFLREIEYFVFNPTTKQYRLLQLDGYRPLTICLMSDPSKPEYYKVLMLTSITPYIYSVYDLATQKWSHNMQGGDPFRDDVLGFRISTALFRNLLVSSIKQGQNHLYAPTPQLVQFPEESAYDSYIFDSNEHINLIQVKTFPGENKLSFRVGVWYNGWWKIRHTETLDFNSKNSSVGVRTRGVREALDFNFKDSSAGVRMLGVMRAEGATIWDAAFLFHVPGQLLIYKINQGVKVLVDYRRNYYLYVKDEWQFKHAHPFIHTFFSV